MAKRFIDTSKYRQAWRKLDPRFRAAYAWLVENADAAGFWVVDLDFFKFECGYALELDKFIKAVGGAVVRHGLDKINLVDFIQVNYGELKEGYNPHKPALRALSASTLTEQEPSLNQACPKLEDEGEEEDITSKRKERAKSKSIDDRKSEFITKCAAVVKSDPARLPDKLRSGFFEYWTEPTQDGKGMRFEAEKFFDHSRRMATWKANAEKRGELVKEGWNPRA